MGGPGTERAERFFVTETGTDPVEEGEITKNAGAFKMKDSVGVFDPRTGGAGEINTGSNVGSAGVGVFDGKVGVDLQLRKLNPINAQSLLTAVLSGQKINLNVLHDSAFWNALKLKGIEIDFLAGLQNGDALIYNSGNDKFERQGIGSGNTDQLTVKDFTSSGTYDPLLPFQYGGTDNWSTVTKIEIVGRAEIVSRPVDFRIFDVDNSLVIAELTGYDTTVETNIDLGVVGNLPTGQALWELQARQPGGGNRKAFVESMAITYG